jgi:phosphate starvation-inducible protein PhoH and related proteins
MEPLVPLSHPSLDSHVTIYVGPSGTGKTYLACEHAKEYELDIFITRPLPLTEKDIGFLPGTLGQKMEPWMVPVQHQLNRYRKRAKVVPFMHLRGLTFEHCLVIADEMQNATCEEMKLLLTRLGPGCRLVMTGDVEQVDGRLRRSGLVDLLRRLERRALKNVEVVHLTSVRRSQLVADMLELYGEGEGEGLKATASASAKEKRRKPPKPKPTAAALQEPPAVATDETREAEDSHGDAAAVTPPPVSPDFALLTLSDR